MINLIVVLIISCVIGLIFYLIVNTLGYRYNQVKKLTVNKVSYAMQLHVEYLDIVELVDSYDKKDRLYALKYKILNGKYLNDKSIKHLLDLIENSIFKINFNQ